MADETPTTPAPVPEGPPEPAADAGARRGAPARDDPAAAADAPTGSPPPPPIKSNAGLTPARSAGIVRQSASARWVGFLTVIIVSLFIVGYWFYELGAPLGLSTPRLAAEEAAQQVVDVERGYNLFEANCARCHGPNGLGPTEPDAATAGYIGPQLNSQEKLFAHLNEQYLRNVLTGRRPLRLRQRQLADAGLVEQGQPARPAELPPDRRADRVPPGDERPHLRQARPVDERADHRPGDGQGRDVHRLARPELQAGSGRDAVPGLLPRRADRRRRRRLGGAGRLDRPERAGRDGHAPSGAATTGFDPTTLEAKADTAFTLEFDNQDATAPHNVVISDPTARPVPMGDTAFFTGPKTKEYAVPAPQGRARTRSSARSTPRR